MAGWQLPGYAETAELGRGGTGLVVAAVQVASGEPVAIKYLADWLAGEQRFRDAFRAEAAILAGLRLPHVAGLREYVEWPGGAAIVMDLVQGVSLRAMLAAAGPAGPLAALSVLRGSLLGLAGAHAAGIVHRDYKPDNVIVDPAGVSMLVDFGIAAREGTAGRAAGTPGYMAPEQWAGAPASPATDIYAAAITYAECLTGTQPPGTPPRPLPVPPQAVPAAWQAQTVQAGQSTWAVQLPPASLAGPTGLGGGGLAGLIARATAAHAADRPASAAQFLTELEHAAGWQYGPGWDTDGRAALARGAAIAAAAAAGAAAGAAAAISVAPASAPGTAPAARATTRLGRTAGRKAARSAAKGAARAGKAGLSHGAITGIAATAAVIAVGAAVTAVVVTHHQHSPSAPPVLAGVNAKWTADQLVIGPRSLGAVRTGMTLSRASAAAGVQLKMVGDGVSYPEHGPPGLSVGGATLFCVAARQVAGDPRVITPQGFPLGGTVAQLKQVYGSKLHFLPAPKFGISPSPGWVVRLHGGNLAFVAFKHSPLKPGRVDFIVAGPGVVPSTECA